MVLFGPGGKALYGGRGSKTGGLGEGETGTPKKCVIHTSSEFLDLSTINRYLSK